MITFEFITRHSRFILFSMLLVWVVFLYIQPGEAFDEAEHAHAAYLIGAKGIKPGTDFFQHHQPLLWDILSAYVRLAGAEKSILLFGRFLVVLSGLVIVWSLQKTSQSFSGNSSVLIMQGLAGSLAYLMISYLIPAFLVIRPETLSMALFLASFVFWISTPPSPLKVIFSGVCLGLSAYSSPRFVLVAGAYLIFPGTTELFLQKIKKWILLGTASAGTFLLYALLTRYSFHDMLFNMEFSTLLQRVGEGNLGHLQGITKALLVSLGIGVLLMLRVSAKRLRLAHALLAYTLVIAAVSTYLCWPYPYVQNYMPAFCLLTLWLAYLEAQVDQPADQKSRRVFATACLFMGLVLLIAMASYWLRHVTLIDNVISRNSLLLAMRDGDTVLVRAGFHPIAAQDASFYGLPLLDSDNRLCEAVSKAPAKWQLPHCDYTVDIQKNMPVLVDQHCFSHLAVSRNRAFFAFLHSHYEPIGVALHVRKDRAEAFRALEDKASP